MILRHKLRILALTISLLTTGCDPHPFDNSTDPQKSMAGITAGAATGVAVSAVLRAPTPMIAVAGTNGAILGYYLTSQRFDAGPIYKAGGEAYTQGEYAGINVPAYRLFEPNSADFLLSADPILDSMVSVLKRYPNANITVAANTSSFNASHRGQQLSTARARQVAAYLWAHGINNFKSQSNTARKLAFVGYGDRFPVTNETKISHIQENNRIQITVYPSQSELLDKKTKPFINVGSFEEG